MQVILLLCEPDALSGEEGVCLIFRSKLKVCLYNHKLSLSLPSHSAFLIFFSSLSVLYLKNKDSAFYLQINFETFRSDQISRSVVSDSLRPHESQHARPPCPSPTPGVHSDSRPSSQ